MMGQGETTYTYWLTRGWGLRVGGMYLSAVEARGRSTRLYRFQLQGHDSV